jgi:hypothetical protein
MGDSVDLNTGLNDLFDGEDGADDVMAEYELQDRGGEEGNSPSYSADDGEANEADDEVGRGAAGDDDNVGSGSKVEDTEEGHDKGSEPPPPRQLGQERERPAEKTGSSPTNGDRTARNDGPRNNQPVKGARGRPVLMAKWEEEEGLVDALDHAPPFGAGASVAEIYDKFQDVGTVGATMEHCAVVFG